MYFKGDTLSDFGKFEEAIQIFNKAIEMVPQSVYAWIGKGKALNNQDKYDEAIEAFDKAIEIRPSIDAWFRKGEALYIQGKYDEAIKAFDNIIEFKVQLEDASICKASILELVALRNRVAWFWKSIVLKKQGKYEEANAAFAKAKELGYTG